MSERVAIVDYGSGNLRSVARACERAAAENGLPVEVVLARSAAEAARADRLILPGVGAFAACRAGIAAIEGLDETLQAHVEAGRPLLGVCVGMQLMADVGLEHGRHAGFGWLRGEVRPIPADPPRIRVPHMGWNRISLSEAGRRHPLFAGLADRGWFYFVHSYALALAETAPLLAEVEHGGRWAAAVGRGSLVGVQFHPEKSQRAGLALIANFLRWSP